MNTITLEEFTDEQRTFLKDLHADSRARLEDAGVKELMPVQQVTHKLFLEGGEIVVK